MVKLIDCAPNENQDLASLLTAALAYGRHGYRVFPVHSVKAIGICSCRRADCDRKGKHPRIKDWGNHATTDEAVIRRWWQKWPDASIGIATGAGSGIVVVDVDPRHGGDDALATLIAEHGAFPGTVEASTGGGGRHLFFAHPKSSVPNKTNLAPGIDIRGDGGFVVVPPSTHVSGQQYEWKPRHSPGELSPAPLPAWSVPVKWITIGSNIESDGPIPEGGRNHALTSFAGTMRRRGMSYEAILAALQEENAKRCRPPLAEDEVQRIATSVARYRPAVATTVGDRPLEVSLHSPDDTGLGAQQDSSSADPVDGAALLGELQEFIGRYVVPPSAEALIAISAWLLSTHAFDLFEQHPFLIITSPEKRCGKTRLLEVLERLAHDPLPTAGMSEAVLFRIAGARGPTFLIDEAQHLRNRDERSAPIHDLLCAGNRRGKKVFRMGGKSHTELQVFEIYCPKAIASIGKLTDIIMDRGIEIAMRRHTQSEPVARYFASKAEAEARPIRDRMARWVQDHRDDIRAVYFSEEPPSFMTDREAENWSPMFAIVRVADPASLPVLEQAAQVLTLSGTDASNLSVGVQLLADIRSIFEEQKAQSNDFVPTKDLLSALLSKEESPWGDNRGPMLNAQGLAKLLRAFGVRPRQTHVAAGVVRGYHRDDFSDAWDRYLPTISVTPVTPQLSSDVQPSSIPLPNEVGSGVESGPDPHGDSTVTEVTDLSHTSGHSIRDLQALRSVVTAQTLSAAMHAFLPRSVEKWGFKNGN